MLSTLLRRSPSHGTIRTVAKNTRRVASVCSWFDDHARPLPWRSSTPWGVVVSEFMLQQTPVHRVESVWRDWITRWPTPQALASEPSGEAVRAWGRLGYPRRALRLHATAQQITDNYEGRVPSGEGELRALPGVGEYTAAAIRAFAFGLESIVLDVNVRRVISRAWSGVDAPASHLSTVERTLAQSLATAADDSSVWAAASMELGAIVCTKKTPLCSSCPLKRTCAWRTAGFPRSGAGRRRQPRYEGSDRQARGRILTVLRESETAVDSDLLVDMSTDRDQMLRALESLESDGLVRRVGGAFALPF